MNAEDFTGNIVSVVIAVIVVQAVAVPIITEATSGEGFDPTLKTILTIIPVFLALAVIMMVVKMFLDKRGN